MTEEKPKRKSKFGIYYGIIFCGLFIFLVIRGCVIENDIENDGVEIVAKYLRKESSVKTTSFYFGYYHAGKYCETNGSGVSYSMFNSKEKTSLIDSLKLNHFYSAKFTPNHPKNIIVNLSKEITDSAKIKNAGF